METERLSPRYSGIDVWDPSDILDAMVEGQFAAVAAVRAARQALEGAALAMEPRLREGGRLGALTVGIANNRDTPLLEEADHPVWLDTGPEPIAGSTRMKAGTAQRIALNLLSSLVMILLGRVYEGMMVDVQAVNNKLVQRSENMLLHLTGRSSEEVRDALARAHGSVKLALLLLQGCDPAEAEEALDRAGGQLRIAKALVDRRAARKKRA